MPPDIAVELTTTDFPHCRKLSEASKDTQPAGEFIEWLATRGIVLAEQTDEPGSGSFGLVPCTLWVSELLAEWKNIDMREVERERREMLVTLSK
jgi:hypothetical protein